MNDRLRQLVRRRAKNSCEYCQIRQDQEPLPFHIEHIIPRRHGGKDLSNNLALACHHCNLNKGANLSGARALGAYLQGAKFVGVDATGFDVRGADLGGATVSGGSWGAAVSDATTTCPNNTRSSATS